MSLYIQYSNSTNLKNLLFGDGYLGLDAYLKIDPLEFYTSYFNLATCNSQGLDNYGRILNQSRFIQSVASGDYYQKFGFGQNGITPATNQYPQNFNNGNFFGGSTNPVYIELGDDDYRILLKFKYLVLTTNFSYKNANLIMNNYAKSKNASYKVSVEPTSNKVMDVTFKFSWALDDFEKTIFNIRGVLPVAMGVAYRIREKEIL